MWMYRSIVKRKWNFLNEANEQIKLDETKRTYCGQRYANECMLGFFYLSNFSPLKGGIFMETTNCAIGVLLLLVIDTLSFSRFCVSENL